MKVERIDNEVDVIVTTLREHTSKLRAQGSDMKVMTSDLRSLVATQNELKELLNVLIEAHYGHHEPTL